MKLTNPLLNVQTIDNSVPSTIEDSEFMKCGPASGVPTSSPNPFIIPSVNAKRNTTRYTQITTVLRQAIKKHIEPIEEMALNHLNILIAMMDSLFAKNPQRFCEVSSQLYT